MAGAVFSVAFDAFPHWGRVKDSTRPDQPIVCSTEERPKHQCPVEPHNNRKT